MLREFLGDQHIGVMGLGYVGLPLAIAFSKHLSVIGLDIDEKRVELLKSQASPTLSFSSDFHDLVKCKIVIVCVPTPTMTNNDPDLGPLKAACYRIAYFAPKDSIAVFESTVYPGATRECSELIMANTTNRVRVGYSPERVVPGDTNKQVGSITKVVSGEDQQVLDILCELYELVVAAGVHRASSIEVAEAAKLLENVQRDVNIALINEYSKYLRKLKVDTQEVLDAAKTKWNFMSFSPGLVGGHCIRDDPYYLIGSAKRIGADVPLVKAARRVNEYMPIWIARQALRFYVENRPDTQQMKALVLGVSFKENVDDMRNSKSVDLINELIKMGCSVDIVDPEVCAKSFGRMYNLNLSTISEVMDKKYHCVILAVKHDSLLQAFPLRTISSILEDPRVLVDVKSAYSKEEAKSWGTKLWCL